jgi:hypothetical protein
MRQLTPQQRQKNNIGFEHESRMTKKKFEGLFMSDPRNKNMVRIKQLLNDDWQERSLEERRSDNDNRNGQDKSYFDKGGKERRQLKERRENDERRDGWMRVGQWRSESVFDDKH